MQKAIAIDFDGTLCTNDYPNIGEPNWEIIAEAKMEQANGAGLILWTCREGEMLDAALKACEEWELHFDAVNESLPSWKKEYGNNPRKVGASCSSTASAPTYLSTRPPNLSETGQRLNRPPSGLKITTRRNRRNTTTMGR